MFQRKAGFALLLILSCLPLAGQIRGVEKPPTARQQPAYGPYPVPTPPPTLEQQPASDPEVTFRNRELTILARNSSLSAILRAVETQTGATIDMPTNPTERVVGEFGPGPATEVLASLLNGSHLNYVLLCSPQDATSLDRVILMNKASTDALSEAPRSADTANASLPYRIAPFDDNVDIATPQDSPKDVTNQQQLQGQEQQRGAPPPQLQNPSQK